MGNSRDLGSDIFYTHKIIEQFNTYIACVRVEFITGSGAKVNRVTAWVSAGALLLYAKDKDDVWVTLRDYARVHVRIISKMRMLVDTIR